MRIAFVNELYKIAKTNKDVVLITGDLGFSVFEQFIEDMPKQFLNAGVAEQNMAGIASGMALEGKIPFIYSIVPFVCMRNFEQIRNDICYQNANVKIVGVGSGYSYGIYGYTHNGLEDVALMRTLPRMTVLSPGDPVETQEAVKLAYKIQGPVYIRLGKAGEPVVHKKRPKMSLGKGIVLRKGRDLTIFATGTMLPLSFDVSDMLNEFGISAGIISMPSIKPLDATLILEQAKKTSIVVTMEDHFITGGLGSAVAEVLAEHETSAQLIRAGKDDSISTVIGSTVYMRNKNNMSPEKITNQIMRKIIKKAFNGSRM